MKFNGVVIIGVGSLGSFLALEIAENNLFQNMVLIDPEKVEIDNLKSSSFMACNLGDYKVDAIAEQVSKTGITLKVIRSSFEKNHFSPNYLKIDCRDMFYGEKVGHVKVYITDNKLIVDARKINFDREPERSSYSRIYPKGKYRMASTIISDYISSGYIYELINKDQVIVVNLDAPLEVVPEREYLITDDDKIRAFGNITDQFKTIVNYEKSSLELCYMGSKKEVLLHEIKTPSDLCEHMFSLVSEFKDCSYTRDSFILAHTYNHEGKLTFYIIPEKGGA